MDNFSYKVYVENLSIQFASYISGENMYAY